MRSAFLACALLLATGVAHARYCGRVPSPTGVTFECGANGAELQMTDVIKAMNEKRQAARYRITSDIVIWLYGLVTIPTGEDAFLRWMADNGLVVASRDEKVIVFELG
jgi:hypothetical protein